MASPQLWITNKQSTIRGHILSLCTQAQVQHGTNGRACCQWLLDSCLEAMMRDSHLTLRAPAMPGATTRTGNPWSLDSSLRRRIVHSSADAAMGEERGAAVHAHGRKA